ncbi:MAG: hypothetical protein ACE5KU_00280 [Nitrososphaerales archaeon]
MNPDNKKQQLPSEHTLDAIIEELRHFVQAIVAHLNKRIEDLEKVKADLEKIYNPDGPDDLPFKDSQYDKTHYLRSSERPEWTRRLKFPLETSPFKYYETTEGNLKRYGKETS